MRLPVPGPRALSASQRPRQRRVSAERARPLATAAAGLGATRAFRRRPACGRSVPPPSPAASQELRSLALSRGDRRRLLDEPLSSLDARTRARAARELSQVLREVEVPTLLVTHDFFEAAQLGDRVGVMDRGRVIQEGTASSSRRAAAVGVRCRLHRGGADGMARAGGRGSADRGSRVAAPSSAQTARRGMSR